MPKKARFKHLHGDPAYYPYAARTRLRRQQRRTARWLRAAGALLLAVAAALLIRQTWLRGGQPAPPAARPAATAAPNAAPPEPKTVTVRPATADVEADVLARTGQADAAARATPAPEWEPAPAPAAAEMLPAYRALYEQNPDLVGWLRIDGTGIDYPVVQRANDNDWYLRRGFDGLYAPGGTLFLDARCDPGFDGDPTANWLVYGHNMADGSMFGTLARYADEEFWTAHPTFTFDTLYESGTWRVAAVLRTDLGADELPYYAFFDASGRAEWQAWMDAILPKALYETGVTPQYGEQLLTLSTCGDTALGTTARLAVLAVREP